MAVGRVSGLLAGFAVKLDYTFAPQRVVRDQPSHEIENHLHTQKAYTKSLRNALISF